MVKLLVCVDSVLLPGPHPVVHSCAVGTRLGNCSVSYNSYYRSVRFEWPLQYPGRKFVCKAIDLWGELLCCSF